MKNVKTDECVRLHYAELKKHDCNDPDVCAVCEELASTPEPDEHVYCNNPDCPVCLDYDVEQWTVSHQTSVEIHDAIADLAHGRADIEAIWEDGREHTDAILKNAFKHYLDADNGQRREECKKHPNENVLFWGDGFSPAELEKY